MGIHGIGALAVLAGAAVVGSANAALQIDGNIPASTEQTGANFLGVLSYAFDAGNMGTLTLDLTNTTPANVGGFLTAFVFAFESADGGASAQLLGASDPDFNNLQNENASPFGGPYFGGSSTSNMFEGGGTPSKGIPVGVTVKFTFKITASDAAALTDDSFAIAGPLDHNFVARFRGLEDGGSDKVPGQEVPTPGAVALMAGAGLAAARRRRG